MYNVVQYITLEMSLTSSYNYTKLGIHLLCIHIYGGGNNASKYDQCCIADEIKLFFLRIYKRSTVEPLYNGHHWD